MLESSGLVDPDTVFERITVNPVPAVDLSCREAISIEDIDGDAWYTVNYDAYRDLKFSTQSSRDGHHFASYEYCVHEGILFWFDGNTHRCHRLSDAELATIPHVYKTPPLKLPDRLSDREIENIRNSVTSNPKILEKALKMAEKEMDELGI